MPGIKAVHWNPPESVPMWSRYKGKTRCGRMLSRVKWSEDAKDVTCDRCLQLLTKDGVRVL